MEEEKDVYIVTFYQPLYEWEFHFQAGKGGNITRKEIIETRDTNIRECIYKRLDEINRHQHREFRVERVQKVIKLELEDVIWKIRRG